MSVLIVIPARYASTRYPGKPLVTLRGASGEAKSLIHRSWNAACEVTGVDRVVIATDDARIAQASEGFGAEVVMTSTTCQTGGVVRASRYLRANASLPERNGPVRTSTSVIVEIVN